MIHKNQKILSDLDEKIRKNFRLLEDQKKMNEFNGRKIKLETKNWEDYKKKVSHQETFLDENHNKIQEQNLHIKIHLKNRIQRITFGLRHTAITIKR